MSIIQVKEVLKRMAAMTILKISGVLAIGSFAGVEPLVNAAMAAGIGILEVMEELSKAYMRDGHLSDEEINAAFAKQAGVEEPVEEDNVG